MTLGQWIDEIGLVVSLMTWKVWGLFTLMVILNALVVYTRNHLNKPRLISVVFERVSTVALWVIIILLFVPMTTDNDAAIHIIALTLVLTAVIVLSYFIAAAWARYGKAPGPTLRAQVARLALSFADATVDHSWAAHQRQRIDAINRSINTLNEVVNATPQNDLDNIVRTMDSRLSS